MIDNIVKITEAAAHLITLFAWPIVALVVLRWLMPIVRLLLSDKSDVSVSGWGWAITAKRESREAVALAETSKDVKDAKTTLQVRLKDSFGKSYAATKWMDHLRIAETIGKTILWVDDNPDNNSYERQALESLGMKVEFVPSTSQALEMIKDRKYDAVISDMSRPEGERAGYDLLAKIKLLRPGVPFILYSSSNTPEQENEIKTAGAYGSTARASELVRLVTDATRSREADNRLENHYMQLVRNLLAHKPQPGS
jgi:CheY-like chemotaxis protein